MSKKHFLTFRFCSHQALVALYEEPEKPEDAAGYLKTNFAGHGSLVSELDAVKSENGQLKQRVETLEKDLGAVRTENRQLKPKMDNQVRNNCMGFSRAVSIPIPKELKIRSLDCFWPFFLESIPESWCS